MHLVRYEIGQIEFRPEPADAPRDLSTRLGQFLGEATGLRWMISVSGAGGEPTLNEQKNTAKRQQRAEVEAHPLIKAALGLFPGATVAQITDLDAAPAAPDPETLAPIAEIPAPENYEQDDPGPFSIGNYWDPDDEVGEDE